MGDLFDHPTSKAALEAAARPPATRAQPEAKPTATPPGPPPAAPPAPAPPDWRTGSDQWAAMVYKNHSREELGAAAALVREHGGEALVKVLNESGIGNHPDLVRFVASVSNALRGRR